MTVIMAVVHCAYVVHSQRARSQGGGERSRVEEASTGSYKVRSKTTETRLVVLWRTFKKRRSHGSL